MLELYAHTAEYYGGHGWIVMKLAVLILILCCWTHTNFGL